LHDFDFDDDFSATGRAAGRSERKEIMALLELRAISNASAGLQALMNVSLELGREEVQLLR